MKPDQYNTIIMSFAAGLFLKILWDWLKNGRAEKGVLMTVENCNICREKCCIGQVKKETIDNKRIVEKYKSKTDVVLKNIDKRLDKGSHDFEIIQSDISEIKTSMATIAASFKEYKEMRMKI